MPYCTPTAEGGRRRSRSRRRRALALESEPSVTCTATDAGAPTPRVQHRHPPAKIRLTRFVAFGDSITFGENGVASSAFGGPDGWGPRFQVPRTYPTVLYQSLSSRYATQSLVVSNAGVPSEFASSSSARSRFSASSVPDRLRPKLLMEGSNDAPGAGQAADAIRSMIQEAQGAGVRPYLATIPPMDGLNCCPRRGSAAPLVPPYNDQLRAVAASEGISLVDVYEALNASPAMYLSDDGLHPNDAGYAKIGETFFEVVKSTLEIPAAQTPPVSLR
jgi:lysophospholipase L1-like esterase